MGSMALCPTVRLLFPSGMAIRHRASSPLLPSFSHLFASLLFFLVIGSSPSLFFQVLGYFLVWPYCPNVVCIAVAVLAVLSLRGTPWFPYRRYAGNSTFKKHNKVSPPLGHWNPETLNPESKHRDIGTSGRWNPKCTGRRKGTDPRTGNGQHPRNGFSYFRYPLTVTGGLFAARFTAEPLMEVTTSWVGARWLQVQFLVSFFPETLRGGASPSLWVANFLNINTMYWGSFVSPTQSVRAWGWWSAI